MKEKKKEERREREIIMIIITLIIITAMLSMAASDLLVEATQLLGAIETQWLHYSGNSIETAGESHCPYFAIPRGFSRNLMGFYQVFFRGFFA